MDPIESETPSEDRFLELITAVADGRLVDWSRLEAAARTDADKRILSEMRKLADVAAAHREDTDVGFDELSTGGRRETRSTRPTKWGKLTLFEQIGEGAFGEVYRAHDPDLDKEVALKLIWSADPSPSTIRDKALREARSLMSVHHSNIAAVHGIALHDGHWGIWLEFVRGLTLAQILQIQGRYSAEEAALIGLHLCDALSAVHSARLVHRDVTTKNVMREEGGRLVLMDFGVAHEIGAAETLAGTPLYLAPELLNEHPATVQSDIYSLGVLLFHLVTNKYPCQGGSIEDIREAHMLGLRVRASDFRPELPETFVAILEKALCADAQGRYRSAKAMRLDLEAYLRPDVSAPVKQSTDGHAQSTTLREAKPAVARIGVFVSYSHEDVRTIDRLKIMSYLKDLESDGCEVWSDHDLRPGDDWNDVLLARLRTSHILVPLVTQDYLRSKYCREVELGEFLRRRLTEGLIVFPVIVSPCEWERYDWLRAIQFLPPRGTLIDHRGPGRKEQLLVSALGELRRLAARLRERGPQGPTG